MNLGSRDEYIAFNQEGQIYANENKVQCNMMHFQTPMTDTCIRKRKKRHTQPLLHRYGISFTVGMLTVFWYFLMEVKFRIRNDFALSSTQPLLNNPFASRNNRKIGGFEFPFIFAAAESENADGFVEKIHDTLNEEDGIIDVDGKENLTESIDSYEVMDDNVSNVEEEGSVESTSATDDDRSDKNSEVSGDIEDDIEDGFFDPLTPDPSCSIDGTTGADEADECWNPPKNTIETEQVVIDARVIYGGDDPSSKENEEEKVTAETKDDKKKRVLLVDKHWGSDETILKMRDKLRGADSSSGPPASAKDKNHVESAKEGEEGVSSVDAEAGRTKRKPHENKRPPIFLMPGLAATRLVSWKFKACSNPLVSDIKVQDYVWMNINMLIQMATIDGTCFRDCMTLGLNQTDMNDADVGCKLRPDEGLDAISSLAPGSLGSNLLVGGTNTVYAWLTQWLADNLGYDVTSIVGLPYDWRLSPDIMEERDGFLTLTRRRIEAAVESNGEPGIMVAHSMGNNVFRYFLEWLKNQMHEEAYSRYVKQAERRAKVMHINKHEVTTVDVESVSALPGWMGGQPHSDYDFDFEASDPAVKYNVGDRMYKVANSVAAGLDDLWKSYFPTDISETNNGRKTGLPSSEYMHSTEVDDSSETDASLLNRHVGRGKKKNSQLWELAQIEGDAAWLEWIHDHIWTYVGLSAPLLGATNPLRAVLSGENMGLPITEEMARTMELSFGSTHTLNPISTKSGFCDNDNFSEEETTFQGMSNQQKKSNLACLDELIDGIEKSGQKGKDPWRDFPALENLLKDRVDWDTDYSPVTVRREKCLKSEKPPCKLQTKHDFNALDVQNGDIFTQFSNIWREKDDLLLTKREQLESSWWNKPFPNLLNSTWDRPHIKHVIMAYGVDVSTEVGYVYKKVDSSSDKDADVDSNQQEEYDSCPTLQTVIFEESTGKLVEESISEPKPVMLKKKPKKLPLKKVGGEGTLQHSGDGSVPYLSLAWAHTWLLHATRAMRHSGFGIKEGERISDDNALESIKVSHRPKGGSEWVEGGRFARKEETEIESSKKDGDGDTGTSHPHGTKYKPEMFRYQSKGKSRSTGMEYTTAVIEAIGVEHKETTRNYDILAAVFTDVLKYMHDDLGLV